MQRFVNRISILVGSCLVIGLAARPSRAEDEVAGRVLFNDATKLANDGQFDAACPKFAESLRQNYNINAHYFLADCLERQGKTATAWGTFLSVATAAKNMKDERRERAARMRAAALEVRLVKLKITVAQELDGLEVRRNGDPVGKAMWGSVIPVDPGEIEVTATAPGFEPVRKFVTATDAGKVIEAFIPALPRQPPSSALPFPPATEPSTSNAAKAALGGAGSKAEKKRSSYWRELGFAAAGFGATVAVVGGVLALSAKGSYDAARTEYEACSAAPCADRNLRRERDAISRANLATGLFVGGAIAAAAGLTIVLTQPRADNSPSLALSFRPSGVSLHGRL